MHRHIEKAATPAGRAAWDMARTFEEAVEIPAELAGVVLNVVEQLAEPGRRTGAFGPPVAVTPDHGAFDRALALSGRNPSR